VFDSPLEGWSAGGKRASARTATENHTADRLIITAGAWASRVLVDLDIRLTIRRKPLLWYATKNDATYSLDARFPAHLFELPYGVFYGFPQIDVRGVKIAEHTGGGEVGEPLTVERDLLPADREPVERFITECLPRATHKLTDYTVCMYTISPDEHFIVDHVPELENVWFCAGLSGHGFKFAPVLGQVLADLACDGQTDLPIGFLRLARFQ
jgi:glycine/D-amino acid oxidase-like deaminating enzyme